MKPTARIANSMAITATVAALLLAFSAQALATTGHAFAGQFGGDGTADGQFSEPQGNGPAGLAVTPTGEVFAAGNVNTGGSTLVQQFNAAGTFQSKFPVDSAYIPTGPIAIDPASSGAVYVSAFLTGTGHILKYSATGVHDYTLDPSSLGTTLNNVFSPGGAPVAVDPANGTVYAAATITDPNNPAVGAQVIDSFDQTTGAFIASFDGASGSPDGGFGCPSGLAVDASHQIYVLDACKGRVDRYSAAGAYEATVDDGSRGAPSAVAVNPTTGEVFVSEAGLVGVQITHFTAGGAAPVYTFDASNVGGVRAMTVSDDGTVYTSDATTPFIERFTQFDGPTVTTDPASAIEARAVTVNGTINPEGVASKYHFQYGTDPTYGSRTEDVEAGSASSAGPASANLTGLRPNLTYHYRIVGSNGLGSITGPDQTFTTAAAPATVDGSPPFVSAITPRGAHVHGTINAENSSFFVTWHMDYGTSAAYGSSSTGGFLLNAGGDDRPVDDQLSGLEPDTLYHFRVVADNGTGGPQAGADQTFITAPAAAAGATGLTTTSATLSGVINGHGQATTYHFNYGPTSSYGATTPEADGGSGDGDQTVAQPLAGLEPSTVYHVQVIATSGGVVRTGADGLFKTPAAPEATAISPTSISASAVTLAGDTGTYGLAGTYHFTVSSLNGSYTVSTGEQTAPGSTGADRVSATVTGLPPGETFAVRLVLTSNESIDVSDPVTFATPALPRAFPIAPAGQLASAPSTIATSHAPVGPPTKPKAKLTRAQLLAKALKSCQKKAGEKRRSACEKKARNTYRRAK